MRGNFDRYGRGKILNVLFFPFYPIFPEYKKSSLASCFLKSSEEPGQPTT
jgi:hypothetical protein